MKLFSKLLALASLGCAAGPLLALNATCTLYDGNNNGWKADVSILDFAVDDVAIVAADVKHPSGCYGSGMDYVQESSKDLAWFNAGGSSHYFQSIYVNWGHMSEGALGTCGYGLVVYASTNANC